jgi:hypothetical protein
MMTGITDPTEPLFKDGGWGWDTSQWRKLPLLWGYSAKYQEAVLDSNMGAGDSGLEGSAVPAGEVWLVKHLSAFVVSATCTKIRFRAYKSPDYNQLADFVSPTTGVIVHLVCEVVMDEGTEMRAQFYDMTSGDDARFYISGYKMKIAE